MANGVEGSKRKRASAGEKPAKRRRSPSDESEDPNAKILLMEQGILESKKNYNNIAILLQTAGEYENGEPESMLAAVALCRIFVRLLAQGSLIAKKSLSEKELVVVSWLRDQLSQYKSLLLRLLSEEEVAVTALTLSMRLLKAEGESLYDKEEYFFPTTFIESIVKAILLSDNEDVRRAFIEEFAEQYDDIRYFTFKSVKNLVRSLVQEEANGLFDRVFDLICALDGVPESADDLEDFYVPKPSKKNHSLRSANQHKKQGQEAWLALMGVINTKDERKRLLDIISTTIAPWFTKPELLADFLTNCYDTGGSMSLLALSGVFYLIQVRNLDYPSFYPKLYSLLDRDILHSKHRSRFFRLLDTFLASTHLPAALVASFLKRLSRLTLNAPPSAIVFVIPWIYNTLKRHPTCTYMLHRVIKDPEVKQRIQDHGFTDPFLPEERDPMETEAIESCLWELVQLQSHYHPNVATVAKVMSNQFTKQSYNMEDFLDHSYASLLEAELGKDVKKAPVIEFQIPKRVFLPQDEPDAAPDSLLVKLWDFGTPT
ncbi:Maturation and nuclear export of 40S ribosomal subunits interacting protein [Conoideocrella luteorostrata]|uniref:Maturation and nuclear export of 40S ribosomal subunits interacting protein n=1 Tax=Conoideocrella luteorostrata TaxID=1105319 RepID=A0AAJ0CXF0_9HYPO|nr:Maturation and nuclear export of 40S ribosomal subunits interacting protein [Conoideocrella luteorostrata]